MGTDDQVVDLQRAEVDPVYRRVDPLDRVTGHGSRVRVEQPKVGCGRAVVHLGVEREVGGPNVDVEKVARTGSSAIRVVEVAVAANG